MKKILRYPVLILMFLNCVLQQYLARNHDMDIWLGGGFGMFSGSNFVDGRVIVCRIRFENDEDQPCFLQGTDSTAFSRYQILPIHFFAEQMKEDIFTKSFSRHYFGYQLEKVSLLKNKSDNIASIRLELWEKTYDANTYKLGTHQISTLEFKK